MLRVLIISFIYTFLVPFLANAKTSNYLLVLGGVTDFYESNEFLYVMSNYAHSFYNREWDVTVLYAYNEYDPGWDKFPLPVARTGKNNPKKTFRFKNYKREMDDIISKTKRNDQVSIYLATHGNFEKGIHSTWWHGKADPSSEFFYQVRQIEERPTADMFYKISRLLKKGVRVHFNSSSCYDGGILIDIDKLVDQYPDLLCVTTSTSSERTSPNDDNWLIKLLSKNSFPVSVAGLFELGNDFTTNTSFTYDAMFIQEDLEEFNERGHLILDSFDYDLHEREIIKMKIRSINKSSQRYKACSNFIL